MTTLDKRTKDFFTYIWVRDISKKMFDVDLDPEVSEEEIANKFNKLNIYCQNFTYEELTKLVSKILGKNYFE